MSKSNYKLCYVDLPWCYFTTATLDEQWGDDWDDAPYDCNAGEPYDWDEHRDMDYYHIRKVAVYGDIQVTNIGLSVNDINSGAASWLTINYWSSNKVHIGAGISLGEFIKLLRENDIEVYTCLPS